MRRRHFLTLSAAMAAGAAVGLRGQRLFDPPLESSTFLSPTHSIVPVVGDGQWIWTEPPKNETGYLEPRTFEARVGLELMGKGEATQIAATTPVPGEFPEQKLESVDIKTQGCEARIVQLAEGAAQLEMAAPGIAAGQVVRAIAHLKFAMTKQYFGFTRENFPSEQSPPSNIKKVYLQNSPGIETNDGKVKDLVKKIIGRLQHPWEQAEAIARWIPQNIRAQVGPYTNVVTAIEKKVGDCEERAALFVACCRSLGIPARLVWVPNHNWAEFYLTDVDGKAHWIPAHTSCYSWFGWNGAHELVIQKGDRIPHPQDKRTVRLLEDWMQWAGARPMSRFIGELEPLASSGDSTSKEAGPGARQKNKEGKWELVGEHPANKYHRNW